MIDFIDVLGQDSIKKALKEALNRNCLGHAYLFCGESGIGKSMLAKIFSRRILCSNKIKEGCDCSNCGMFFAGVHPDYYVVDSDGNSIGIDKIRKMQAQVIIKPMYGGKKVFLIEDAGKMTIDAQNALLKTLEDPPEYVVIIMCSNNYDMLLDTIKSRVVKYSFKKNSTDELEEYLRKNNILTHADKNFVVSYANGNIGRLINIIENKEQSTLRDVVIDYALNIKRMDRLKVVDAINFFVDNKENVEYMMSVMITVYRDMLVMKEITDDALLTNSDKRVMMLSRLEDFVQDELILAIEIIENTIEYIRANANFGLSVEVMFSRMQGVC